MALFKPFRGTRTSLDAQELHDGYAYFCIDDGSFHIDYVDSDGNLQRKQINAKKAEKLIGYDVVATLNNSAVEIPTSAAVFEAIAQVPEDEFILWLNEAKVVEPVASTSGEVYTTNNNELYVL